MKQLILILLLAALYSGNSGVIYDTDISATEQVDVHSSPEQQTAVEVVYLTEENYYETIENVSGVCLVDFWAEWCGPCMELGVVLDEVSCETGITIYKVNVDDCPNVSDDFNITALPTVLVYNDGEVIESIIGFSDKRTYVDLINGYNSY